MFNCWCDPCARTFSYASYTRLQILHDFCLDLFADDPKRAISQGTRNMVNLFWNISYFYKYAPRVCDEHLPTTFLMWRALVNFSQTIHAACIHTANATTLYNIATVASKSMPLHSTLCWKYKYDYHELIRTSRNSESHKHTESRTPRE